jgi:hypothetical protein
MGQAAQHDGLSAVASHEAGLSTWARRPDRRPAGWRLDGGARTWSPDVDTLGAVPSRLLGSNRADEREAASRRPRGWIGRIDHEVLPENGGDHLVLHDLGHDIPLKVGGSLSPQSWCTMSKYRVSPTMKTFSIAPIV